MIKKPRYLLGMAVLLSLAMGVVALDFHGFSTTPMQTGGNGVTHVIAPGASLTTVTEQLAARGVLTRPRWLLWYGRLTGAAGRLKAGEYALNPGTTPLAALARWESGDMVQHSLTLVEGWTFRQMRRALQQESALEDTLTGLDDAAVMQRLGRVGEHPEGRFYPDTYRYSRGVRDIDILRLALERMDDELARAWERRAPSLPYRTPYEALVLASIVEKETGHAAERAEIAGVLVRRLKQGMLLQTDPTVIYGLGSSFDGNLRRRDLQADNPYNTYRHSGLPPTPIAAVGAAALAAALHPMPGQSLFFVARGDGTHVFSATVEEHNRAVALHQLKIKPDDAP